MSNHYSDKQKHEVEAARAIHDHAKEEGRDLTEEEVSNFSDHMSKAKSYGEQADKFAALESYESSMKESAGRISKPEPIHNEIQKYSLLRAMNQMATNGKLDGLEAEVSAEVARKSGKSPQGFFMPMDLPVQKFANLDTTSGAGALHTVTDYGNFIELLRNRMLVRQLGARVLSDLNGAIQIPKQTGGATAYWIDTDGTSTITQTKQDIGQVSLSPNTCAASTKYTRAFLRQTSMDVEQFARNDLAAVYALELDRVALNGSGSGSEPEGLLQNSSVDTVALGDDGAAPSFAKMVEMETSVAENNADTGSLAYVTTPAARGKMKTTEIASNTARMIWENNQINGYAAYATNQLPSNLTKGDYGTGLSAAIFGNWNDVLYGFWGGIDVIVNPYKDDVGGKVSITLLQEVDVAFRHLGSFSKCVDIVTS